MLLFHCVECTAEEQHSVVRSFFVGKKINAKDIRKKMFPNYIEKYVSRKAVHSRVANV
jgi:hypothetical protein